MDDGEVPSVVIPDATFGPPQRSLRYWLLRRVARGDLVVINATLVIPPGFKLCKTRLDQHGLVYNCVLRVDSPESVPGEVVLFRPSS